MQRTGGPADRRTVDRRVFLGAAGAVLLGGLTRPGSTDGLTATEPASGALQRDPGARESLRVRPPVRPPGIQLYTLRKLLQRDFERTIAALAQIGYREVEFAGLYGRSAAEVRRVLDRHRLQAPAGHCDIPAITDGLDRSIAQAGTLGHRYVVVAWIPEEARTPDGYAAVADTLNQAGERLRRAGLTLGYHNHWFEFGALEGDRCGYDILLEGTDPALVVMELDLFWIRKGGRDALTYFAQHPGRFRMIHIKDMAADGAMVDVGQGVMDWPTLLEAAGRAGVEYGFVEHDEAKDPLAFARTSLAFIEGLLKHR